MGRILITPDVLIDVITPARVAEIAEFAASAKPPLNVSVDYELRQDGGRDVADPRVRLTGGPYFGRERLADLLQLHSLASGDSTDEILRHVAQTIESRAANG